MRCPCHRHAIALVLCCVLQPIHGEHSKLCKFPSCLPPLAAAPRRLVAYGRNPRLKAPTPKQKLQHLGRSVGQNRKVIIHTILCSDPVKKFTWSTSRLLGQVFRPLSQQGDLTTSRLLRLWRAANLSELFQLGTASCNSSCTSPP